MVYHIMEYCSAVKKDERLIHDTTRMALKINMLKDFHGGTVAKTLHSQCRGPGSILGQGTRSHMPQLKRFCVPQLRPGTAKER